MGFRSIKDTQGRREGTDPYGTNLPLGMEREVRYSDFMTATDIETELPTWKVTVHEISVV